MTNHLGVNGLQHRRADIYRPTLDELRQRGSTGGKKAGQRRHSSAKWKAVDAAVAACKAGVPSWSAFADFYDAAYAAGYGATYNNARRKAKNRTEAA